MSPGLMSSAQRTASSGRPLHRQRGAIAISSAAILVLFGLFMALAVDTGRLFFEKRRLQQQADMAALQAAQLYCSGFTEGSALTATITNSLADHGFDTGDAANTVAIDIGEIDINNFRREFVDSAATESVRVTLTRTVPASLFAGSVFNDITLTAASTAKRDLIGTITASSSLLTIDSTQSPILNSLLGGLLGSSINLSLANQQGLLDADVTLLALRDELAGLNLVAQAATIDDLLNLDLSLGDWLQVVKLALEQDASVTSGTISAVNEMISLSGASGNDQLMLSLGDLFSYQGDDSIDEQALTASIPALHLITTGLLQANEGENLSLDLAIDPSANAVLNALIGNTLNLNLNIAVAPNIAIGPFGYDSTGLPITLASTGNINLQLNLQIPDPSASGSLLGLLTGVLSVIVDIQGDLALAVNTGIGSAWLDRVDQCPRLLDPVIDYAVSSESALANIRVGSTADPSAPATLTVNLLFGLIPIPVELGANIALAGNSSNDSYHVDLSQPDALPKGASSSTTLSSALQSSTIELTGALGVGILNGLVSGLLQPLLVGVAQLALDPLLELLGVNLGEVEYQVMDIEEGKGELLL